MSPAYDDDVVRIDRETVLVKSYLLPGRQREIRRDTILGVSVVELGPLSGRYRLVGLGFRRPRNFFHWDPRRSKKGRGIVLDTGRLLRPVITPDDHDAAMAALEVEPRS